MNFYHRLAPDSRPSRLPQTTGSGSGTAPGPSGTAGSAEAAGGSDPASHPCDFVTTEEAASFSGQAVSPLTTPNPGICVYGGVNPPSSRTYAVIGFKSGLAKADYETVLKARAKNPQPVAGVGDTATCDTKDEMTAALYVFSSKGKRLFIDVTGNNCDLDKQFAQKALSRI